MLILYALREAYQSLKTHMYRALAMGFGVSWAIFVLVLLLGIGNGFHNGISQAFAKYGVKTMIIWGGKSAGSNHPIPLEMAANLSKPFGTIQHASPILWHDSPVRYGTKQVAVWALGCDPCYASLANLSMQEGRFFTPRDQVALHHVCVMGICIKKKLFGAASAIGQYIFLGDTALQVVGVLDPLDTSLYSEAHAILLTDGLFKKIFSKHSHYTGAIRLTLVPTAREEVVETQFRTYFARHLNFDVKDTKALGLFSIAKHADKFNRFFKNISIFNTIIGIFLLIIGIVGISNMMLVTIQERRQEIAIRKVLGGRSIEIVAMILSEVVIVTLIAGIIGFAAGCALMQLLNKWVVPLCKAYYLSTLTCPPSFVLGGLGLTALTSCLAGMLPTIRAVRIKPVEALGGK
ncbi:MAG: ABC transporter permease [Candidatus Cardinium sp.]|uniref:ABC transporter permease n=1 Tax=Cardinium endosymbiont of Dermatophagoides farinae TaxID=2597823 RepID=UPI001184236C|nr:ABC transporter permease [Cardinium endosymbiont of Dermatophagoides farinae]TSJ80594.1 ABC transporter permease [Cardinium endosymbiont of Dermatophagoides farinae]UWW96582.1 MAG: ABC transporter permease [Candidatus Cardinium sp.]